jgi:hypothetical protein
MKLALIEVEQVEIVPVSAIDVELPPALVVSVEVSEVGEQGPPGPPGADSVVPGPPGDPGLGLPPGGTTGQILAKTSATDYDTEWKTVSGVGGATDWADITGKPSTFPPTLPIAQSGVTNLVTDLSGKEPSLPAGGTTSTFLRGDKTWAAPAGGGGGIPEAPTDAQQYGRQSSGWTVIAPNPTWTTLSGKPATFPPTLPIAESDVTNLVTDLAGKAATVHTHAQVDVTNLTTDLAGKVSDTGDTMTGPLVLPTGTAAATTLNFGTAGSGLYFASSAVNVAISGASKLAVGATLITASTMVRIIDGTAAAPSYSFTNNTNMGLWRVGADQLGLVTVGVTRLTLSATALTSTLPVVLPADPTATLEAATKGYIDGKLAGKITVASSAPSSPATNDIWIDTT